LTSFQRGVYPAEDFTAWVLLYCIVRASANKVTSVKKYGLNMLGKYKFPCRTPNASLLMISVSSDDQVKAYIKKIMSQLDKWMVGGKISKLVVVITSKDTGEHVERWQFDVSAAHCQIRRSNRN
jgi:mitotic spindle assembly checkpoint protein MAD2